jgi:predicted Fe-Mo cluster-binding NifX family protein
MTDRSSVRLVVTCEDAQGIDSPICQHFGHSPAFVVVDVTNGAVTATEVVANPMAAGHVPGALPDFISKLGANVVITGGMGGRAIALFQERGIEVASQLRGSVRDAVEAFVGGRLQTVSPCREHGHEHGCGH